MSKKEESKAKDHNKSTEPKSGIVQKILDFKEYVLLSKAELRKVSWPSLKETRTTSLVVLGFVVVMALVLALVDFGLSSLMRFILGA